MHFKMKFQSIFILFVLIAKIYSCEDVVTFRSALVVSDTNHSFAVSKTTCHLHVLDLKTSHLNNTVSIHLETTTAHQKDEVTCPMVFSLTQSKSTKSWALPLLNETTKEGNKTIISHNTEFTICLEQDNKPPYANASVNNIELLLFVSTCNPSNVNYTVKFTLKRNTIVGLNKNSGDMLIIPTTLYYFRFNFPDGVDRVIVEVQSEDQVCMTVAIQSPWCRLLNENSLSYRDRLGMALGFKSFLQDMSKKAVIPVDKTDLSEGFFIAFMIQPDDHRCGSYKDVSEKSWIPVHAVSLPEPTRIKIINFTVHGVLSASNYSMPLLFPLAYVLVIIVITTATYVSFHCVNVRMKMLDFRVEDSTEEILSNDELGNDLENGHSGPSCSSNSSQGTENPSGSNNYYSVLHADTETSATAGISVTKQEVLEDSDSDVDEKFSPPTRNDDANDVMDKLCESTVQQVSVRFRNATGSTRSNVTNTDQYDIPWLRMDAFIRKRKVKKSLDRVYILIGAVGIFYGLPSVQLLYTYHQISESTGQTDLCYRNYLCSHRIYSWDDFNHIYSNIVYVLLAAVFCIFVRLYQKKVKTLEINWQEHGICEGDIGRGVGHQFGIFYGLGSAFGFVGILSGVYHICPTEITFQFDTSFMFILAALSTIKIYQFRHPNRICPNNTFGLLALASFISVGGIHLGSKIYDTVFIVLHVAMIVTLSVYLYYIGYIRDEENKPVMNISIFRKSGILKKFRNDPLVMFKPDHRTRLAFLIPLILFNLAICIGIATGILGASPFPSYLVYIFAGNMMFYFSYYCAMKVYHGEAYNIQFIQPFVYLIFSFALGSLGMKFFSDVKCNASLSPAESRALNRPCFKILWSFYDSHDAWHFLSAGSIFFFFMTLLTLDDGIILKPRQEIVAF